MSDERRGSARILNDFSLVLMDERGTVIDEHAIAHDLSAKGFRAELHGDVVEKQPVRFQLSLDGGVEFKGRARIAWVQRTDFSIWAGAEFVGLTWAEKRMLKAASSGPSANWMLVATRLLLGTLWIGGGLAFAIGVRSNFWRPQMVSLAPKALAAVALGWGLLELLTPDRPDY